jgi:hypothetical protein
VLWCGTDEGILFIPSLKFAPMGREECYQSQLTTHLEALYGSTFMIRLSSSTITLDAIYVPTNHNTIISI